MTRQDYRSYLRADVEIVPKLENKENVYVYVITLPTKITITISTCFIQAGCIVLPQMYFLFSFAQWRGETQQSHRTTNDQKTTLTNPFSRRGR